MFCLKWWPFVGVSYLQTGHRMEEYLLSSKDFSASIKKTFSHLANDTNFADVTLACNDDKQLKAHKVILGGSSNFFRKILLNNPHQHPFIYLKGLQFEDIKVTLWSSPCPNASPQAVLEYLYLGETRIRKDQVSSFLDTARELQVEGLGAGIELQEEPEKEINSADVHMEHSPDKEDGGNAIIEEESGGKESPRNTLECDICGFKSNCHSDSNSRTSIKRHKKTAHPNLEKLVEGSIHEDTQNKTVKNGILGTENNQYIKPSAPLVENSNSILEDISINKDTLTKNPAYGRH